MAANGTVMRASRPEEALRPPPGSLATLELDGRWRGLDDATCALLGRTEADLVGRPFADVVHPGDRAMVAGGIGGLASGALPIWNGLPRLLHPDGRLLWTLLTLTPADGAALCLELLDVGDQFTGSIPADAVLWLQTVLTHSPVVVVSMDLSGHVIRVSGNTDNRPTGRLMGSGEVASILEVYRDQPALLEAFGRAALGETQHCSLQVGTRTYDCAVTPMLGADGAAESVMSIATDVTAWARVSSQQSVVADLGRRALERPDLHRLRAETVDVVGTELGTDMCSIMELQGDELRLVAARGFAADLVGTLTIPATLSSPAGRALLSGSAQRIVDLTAEGWNSPVLAAEGAVSGVTALIGHPRRRTGVISVFTRTPRVFTDQEVAFLDQVAYVLHAATQRIRSEEEIRHRALHDALTELPNRALLVDRLGMALAREERRPGSVTVAFVDLDGFKAVNDVLGHDAGDLLLQTIASRLRGVVRPMDTVGRLSGDEFAVLCEDLGGPRQAVDLARRILDHVAVPISLYGRDVTVTASVGLAISAHDTRQPEALLRDADVAMYTAKRQGRSRYEIFDTAMRARVARRVQLEDDLRVALERGELRLAYQPIVTLDGDLVGFEALMRWDHPRSGAIAPGEFVPMAEEAGLIGQLGSWALFEACGAASRYAGELTARTPLRIAVNASVRQLADPHFVELVAAALTETRHGRPFTLCVEITESVLTENVEEITRTVTTLHELGAQVAIDDFGTGYSSLKRLQQLSVDCLKVDKDFVAGLGSSQQDEAIVEAVLGLGRTLGLQTIAEGVETAGQLERLRQLGCDLAQGHYLAPPEVDVAGAAPPAAWRPGTPPRPRSGLTAAQRLARPPAR